MPVNPLESYVKEIIHIGTEIQERDVWRCRLGTLDRIQAIEALITNPPEAYAAVIARLRSEVAGGDYVFAGVQDFVDIRSVEPTLIAKITAADDAKRLIAEENRPRVIAEAKAIMERRVSEIQ